MTGPSRHKSLLWGGGLWPIPPIGHTSPRTLGCWRSYNTVTLFPSRTAPHACPALPDRSSCHPIPRNGLVFWRRFRLFRTRMLSRRSRIRLRVSTAIFLWYPRRQGIGDQLSTSVASTSTFCALGFRCSLHRSSKRLFVQEPG